MAKKIKDTEKDADAKYEGDSTARAARNDDGVKDAPKPRKITKKDWQKVQRNLKDELDRRKQMGFRQQHEDIWKEVDRQIAMQAMIAINRDGSQADPDWHSTIELGELSKASENVAADVRRIVFPNARFWFDSHSDISGQLDEMGNEKITEKMQERVDGRLRAFMMQQHADFGLKDAIELSIKDALHHGSFVAEVRYETQEMVIEGKKVKSRGCPRWIPHSMWNAFPDPSPSIIGTNMFYEGTMFIESYLPRHLAEKLVKSGEEGWMPSQWTKIPKNEEHQQKTPDSEIKTKDIKIVTYWGDVVIDKDKDDTLYFPNHKVVLMNGIIVYMLPNETPYPPIIFKHYERQDVRDPYGTSPIIKQSPAQKLCSTMANQSVDGIALKLEPPLAYDGNDPDFVLNGGPTIRPGAKVSTKGSNAFQQVEIGDPKIALDGLAMMLSEMKEKLGRPGRVVGDRATKAEVVKAEQDQEASLVGFIDKLETALRSYLYMQHAMNVEKCDEYSFYSGEMTDPAFIKIVRSDIPKTSNFEVVGARGVLGEQERSQKLSVVTAFAAGNPLFAPLIDAPAILLQMFQDAGIKNPERFVQQQQGNPQLEQAKQVIQKLGGMLQQEKQKSAVKMAKIQSDHQSKASKLQSDHATKIMKIMADYDAKMKAMKLEMHSDMSRMLEDRMRFFEEQYTKRMAGPAERGMQQ